VEAVESVALWIGSPDRPLFAWLDLPDSRRVAGVAVVCPSMGLEAAYSTRTLRHLGRRLAAAGWAALRLDYAATGDSVGTWSDHGLVAEWLGNVRSAIDYARALGAPRVAVVGLRLGATLGVSELGRGEAVDDLVLWDPCLSGKAFLREQTAFAAFRRELAVEWGTGAQGRAEGPEHDNDDAGSVDAPGAVFSAETAADLAPLEIPRDDRTLATRELVLTRQGRKIARLAQRLALSHVDAAEIEGQEALFEEKPVTPEPTLDLIVSWLAEAGGPLVPLALPERRPFAIHRAAGRSDVQERPVELGPAHLFGMFTETADGGDAAAPVMIFLNVGLLSHHGPGRLWVELARACAAGGAVRCLRIDLSGIGDSPARPGRREMRDFPLDALEDLDDIRRAAGEGGAEVMLMGVCSGADMAIETALARPVSSLCVINPALSYVKWGDHASASSAEQGAAETADPQTWGATGPLLSRAMARFGRYRRLARWMPTPAWWLVKRWLMTGTPVRTLEHLAESGVNVLLVVGSEESLRIYQGEQHRLSALVAKGDVRFESVPGLDHSLLERSSHELVVELLRTYVTGRAAHLSGPERGPALPS